MTTESGASPVPKGARVWLVHLTRDYETDTVYVFSTRDDATEYVANNPGQWPGDPYEAVVE